MDEPFTLMWVAGHSDKAGKDMAGIPARLDPISLGRRRYLYLLLSTKRVLGNHWSRQLLRDGGNLNLIVNISDDGCCILAIVSITKLLNGAASKLPFSSDGSQPNQERNMQTTTTNNHPSIHWCLFILTWLCSKSVFVILQAQVLQFTLLPSSYPVRFVDQKTIHRNDEGVGCCW